ncbi:MAG: NAD(P)-dependent oxidoreductase [Acidobacteriota bacterium]|nr:NAD(P)-dependent oxidoreductase [Acidobacteriota bacterium]
MNILVTGGSGFLGTHIREYFGADDFSRRSNLDLLNLQDAQTVEEYDAVIHLAATLDKSPDAAEEVFLTNVEGTINLLRSMREDSVFIFASTKDVYGRFAANYREVPETCPTIYNGQSALEWSKLIAERYVEFYAHQNKFRSCIFRLSTVYAPASTGNAPNFVTHYAEAINNGEPLGLPANGAPKRDLLYVEDLARACESFIDSVVRHGLYNLGGGAKNAVSLRGLITKMEEISGYQAVIDEENPLPAPFPMNYVTDLTLVGQELDWQPETELDEGLKRLF